MCVIILPLVAWRMAEFGDADRRISLGEHFLTFIEQLLLEGVYSRGLLELVDCISAFLFLVSCDEVEHHP